MNAPLTPSMLKPAASIDWPADAIPQAWVEKLFGRMSAMYGSKFADLWRGTDLQQVQRVWGQELGSLSNDELRDGVAGLRNRPFPPTLPEFVALCRRPINVDAALYEAAQQLRLRAEGKDQWSNPAIYWAAIRVGEFDMLNLSHGALVKRFGAALDAVLAQDQIEDVPPRTVALPAPGRAHANADAVQQAVEKVRAIQRAPGDKDWATRILERVKRGEKVPVACHEMAKRALGIAADPMNSI